MAQELNQTLWNSANIMRGSMDAAAYKDYLLGLVFYKYLSDRQLYSVADLLEFPKPKNLIDAQKIFEDAQTSEDWETLLEDLQGQFVCVIPPEFTFTAFYNKINNQTFMTDDLRQGMRDLEQSGENKPYEDLFEDFDIDSKNLGNTPAQRNKILSGLIKELFKINFEDYGGDALGDAYEYLIGEFAAGSGKKAGEFYTPQSVSKLIAQIVTLGQENKIGFTVYDPCMGSGSLLLQIRNFVENKSLVQFFGQENIHTTYNLARMNMILHNVPFANQHFRNGDSLSEDWPSEEPTNFDAVCMNPPYSQQWSAAAGFLNDPRFQPYERLAPKSKADLAFLLHGFYHLKDTGTMGIVLPHGVLFRGAAEGIIRRHLLESGNIFAVIGLPSGIFFNTGIPTCIIVLKKKREGRDILFIDASKEFQKDKAQNFMLPEHVEKIVDAYKKRGDIEKFSHLATYEEIQDNNFNLNIPRYVDTFEQEEVINLSDVAKDISAAQNDLQTELKNFVAMTKNLRGDNALQDFLKVIV